MILSTLGLSPHGFALGLYPKGLIPMEIFVHLYIPMILPISSQCGTLVVYPTLEKPNGHSKKQRKKQKNASQTKKNRRQKQGLLYQDALFKEKIKKQIKNPRRFLVAE